MNVILVFEIDFHQRNDCANLGISDSSAANIKVDFLKHTLGDDDPIGDFGNGEHLDLIIFN